MSQGAAMIFGKEAVVEQYNDYELDCWAVYQGKMRVKKGCDGDDLSGLLDKLGATPSNALYTLKVYDTAAGDLASITDKTEPAGAFNFKLFSAMMSGFGGGGNEMLHARLAAIEHKLDGGGTVKKEKKKTLGDVLMGYLENPDDLVAVIGAVKMLTGGQPAGAVAGFKVTHTEEPATEKEQPTEEDMNKLADSLDVLGKADAKFIDHMAAFAELSRKDPVKFAFIMKAFDQGL